MKEEEKMKNDEEERNIKPTKHNFGTLEENVDEDGNINP